jgi:hypothetical protein
MFITPHYVPLATTLAIGPLTGVHVVAMRLATQAAGEVTIGVVFLTATVLAAVARALRGVFDLVTGIVTLIIRMATGLVIILGVIVLVAAILVHH